MRPFSSPSEFANNRKHHGNNNPAKPTDHDDAQAGAK